MKKLSSISPFLLLLVPVFIMALFSIAVNSDSPAITVALTSLTR